MATKKKEEIKSTEEVVETKQTKTEKALQEEIELLKQQLQALTNAGIIPNNNTKNVKRNIKFVNMVAGNLNLRGNRTHRFEGQFATKNISESEAVAIIQNMPETISSGMVYIADAQFVKDYELEDIYENILSDKTLKQLLSKDANSVYEVYQNANDTQKQIIINMVQEKQLNNEAIDANILIRLSKVTGQNLLEVSPIEE